MDDPNDAIYQEIKQRVDRLFEARTQFLGHAVAFMVAMVAVWFYLIPQAGWNRSFFFVVSIGWLMGFSVHIINMVMFELRERALRDELDRAGYYAARTGKSKRDERLVRLSEDGELEDVYPYPEDDLYSYDAANRQ